MGAIVDCKRFSTFVSVPTCQAAKIQPPKIISWGAMMFPKQGWLLPLPLSTVSKHVLNIILKCLPMSKKLGDGNPMTVIMGTPSVPKWSCSVEEKVPWRVC